MLTENHNRKYISSAYKKGKPDETPGEKRKSGHPLEYFAPRVQYRLIVDENLWNKFTDLLKPTNTKICKTINKLLEEFVNKNLLEYQQSNEVKNEV